MSDMHESTHLSSHHSSFNLADVRFQDGAHYEQREELRPQPADDIMTIQGKVERLAQVILSRGSVAEATGRLVDSGSQAYLSSETLALAPLPAAAQEQYRCWKLGRPLPTLPWAQLNDEPPMSLPPQSGQLARLQGLQMLYDNVLPVGCSISLSHLAFFQKSFPHLQPLLEAAIAVQNSQQLLPSTASVERIRAEQKECESLFRSFRSTLDGIWRSASAIKMQIDGNMELLRARGEALDGLYDDRVTPYILSLSSVARRVMGSDGEDKLAMDHHGTAPSAPDEDAGHPQGSPPPPTPSCQKRGDRDDQPLDTCAADEERNKRTRIMSESPEADDNSAIEVHSDNDEQHEADVPQQKSSDDKAPSSPSPNQVKGHARSSEKAATSDEHAQEGQTAGETSEKQSGPFAKANHQPLSAENGSIKTRSRLARAPVPFNQLKMDLPLAGSSNRSAFRGRADAH